MSLERQLADYGQLQEEMFGPISVDEITSPAADQRRVTVGTRPPQTRLGRGIGWAVAAFVVVLTVGGLYFAFSGEDGQVVDQTTVPTPTTTPFSLLDGEVTFAAAPPWRDGVEEHFEEHFPGFSDTYMRLTGGRDIHVVIATDPLPFGTGCESDTAPADAEALARSLMADPNFETTGTVPVRIAGIDALQMDVDAGRSFELRFAAGVGNPCWGMWAADQVPGRIRLYLIDYPGESAQVLTIAVIAPPETDFERVLEEATPIVESLEIHTD